MTFVGKILVIVIMVFALFFLALTTVVFQTEQNWKDRVTSLSDEKSKLQQEKQRLEGEVATQVTNVEVAKKDLVAAQKSAATELKDVQDQNIRRQTEITTQRNSTEMALQETAKAQAEAEARIAEATVLRGNLEKVQNQRDEFKLQKTDLDQQILLLKRELEVAINNNKNLRERVTLLGTALRNANLSDDVERLKGLEAPPIVEGEVVKVDAKNQNVEISIGSNDGLKVGHILYLYRTSPSPEFLGKIEITQVDVQQAVGRVIGKTLHGKKIQEGDNVSTKISPRG
jgi:hypothetical protein